MDNEWRRILEANRPIFERIISPDTDERIVQLLFAAGKAQVHPILAQTNWDEVSTTTYLAIGPSIVLASRIITSPLALLFWHAVLFEPQERVSCRKGEPRFVFRRAPAYHDFLPDEEVLRVHKILDELAMVISFDFVLDISTTGWCRPVPFPSRFRGTAGVGSDIELNSEQLLDPLDVRTEKQHPLHVVLSYYTKLASVLVHEIAHAMSHAWHGSGKEMFFENDICCELGFAFKNFVLGGQLFTYRPPHPEAGHLRLRALPSAALTAIYQENPNGAYLMPLRGEPGKSLKPHFGAERDPCWRVQDIWLERLFLQEFWENEIPRSGGRALRARAQRTLCIDPFIRRRPSDVAREAKFH